MSVDTLNVLAIETATETVGVAVRTGAGVQAELALTGRRRHVEALTPAVDHLLGQVGLAPQRLDLVAVDLGPGLFTGLRVGVAAAKGLAQSLGIGVCGATSLDVLTAAAAAQGQHGLVLAAVDARRGELFVALRDLATAERRDVIAPRLATPDQLAAALARLEGVAVRAVGDGAQRYGDVLVAVPGVEILDEPRYPPPATLLALALARLEAGAAPDRAASVVPLYLRDADARVNFARADAAPAGTVAPGASRLDGRV